MFVQRTRAVLLSLLIVGVVSGCSSSGSNSSHMHQESDLSMVPIQVTLSWSPKNVTSGQTFHLEAKVTQDEKPVDDAKEVMFEIVDTLDEAAKVELEGKAVGEGKYTAEATLSQKGTYRVTSHVTARTQHSMPSQELIVE